VLLRCKDNKGEFWGIERLVFQVNQKGGVSYGCEATCKRRRKRSKEEEAAIAEYERRVLTQPATGATKADVEQADDWDAQQDDEPQVLRPAAITGLLPELQATPLVQALQGGLRERFGAEVAGRRFFLLASQAWVIEFVGKPRAQRTKDLLGTRVSAPLGLGAIGGQMLFWFYGVPMAIAIVVSVGAGAAAGGAAAAGAAAPAATGAGGLTLADLVALGGRAANDVTIQQVSKAAAVVLVLAVARSASADEGARDYGLGEAHGIMAVPVDAVGNQQAGIGDEVDHDGFKRVVVGTAQVP
jgi:hypothetical protein